MPDPHPPDAALREELVAYLDGELAPEEARVVEERLSRDERYRREMQGFDRAWNALEQLPRAAVDDSFTKTTIEMVAVAAERELAQQTQALPLVRRRRTLLIAAVAAIAATLGFALARIVFDQPDRVLLTYLPIVQNLDAYSQNLSPEFLAALHDQAADILEPYQDEELQRELELYRKIDAATMSQRREIVEKLSESERAALRANFHRFRELTPEYRENLVELHEKLRDVDKSEELERTMLAYWAWLQERRNGGADQADLRSTQSTAERLQRIRDIERGQNRRLSLSPEEAAKLRAVVKDFSEDDQLQAVLDRLSAKQPRGPDSSERRAEDWTRHPLGRLSWYSWQRPDDPQVKEQWDRLRTALLEQLPPETRVELERDGSSRRRLFELVGQAMFEGERPSEDELAQFFASGTLNADRVQEMLAMPRDEMLRELTREYLREEFGSEGPWYWRDGRRGDRRGPWERFDRRDGRPDGPPRRGDRRFDGFRDEGPGPPGDRERRPPGPPRDGEPLGSPPPRPQGPPPLPEDEAI
jgi:hypothetical protein